MRADKLSHPVKASKEVSMTKRLFIAIGVAVALLVLAVPAMAWNGYRQDYTTTAACQTCHAGIAGIPAVYGDWVETKHAEAGADNQAMRLPYGSSCAGCHTSNFDPSKVVPTPTATAANGNVSWAPANGLPTESQTAGSAASSENFVGCSSCHYGANVGGGLAQYGSDANDTAHMAPKANLANAEICGQCHSRYSYTATTYPVASVPYVKVTGDAGTLPAGIVGGTPIPNPSPTTLLQPQYAIGFKMLGTPTAWITDPLSSVLIVPKPNVTPTPNPAATTAAGLMKYWQVTDAKGVTTDTPWVINGHDGSAVQYVDWSSGVDRHNQSLESLKAVMGPNPPASCLKCHSADYIIAPDNAKPTGAEAKYGITCVGCHTPHERGTAEGIWNSEFTPQLRTDGQKTLCVTCHNGDIPEGGTAAPGSEVHHPMKEMIDGYGAIDVPGFPSVHKGKCVQCHMPPTTLSRGDIQLGANHTFDIIEPADATAVNPVPFRTTTPSPGATPVVETMTMPYSACTTCHSRPDDDAAMWLQDTIDQRQDWTHAMVDQIWAALNTAAVNLGYADTDAAHTALVAKAENTWTTAERAFLSSFTNNEFVESEGSFGLHNWDYSRAIVNTAMSQAKIAQTGVVVKLPWKVTLSLSKSKIKANTKVKFSGSVKTAKGVAGTGTAKIMKRVGGVWKVWKNAKLKASGKYSITVKLTKKGTFYFRTLMPKDSLNKAANSAKRKLVVK